MPRRSWPNPIIADSGNGWHLLYRIDLPADDGGLVASVLKALVVRFSDEAVDIDTKVGNASRICKLYGSLAAKGENTLERPHRVSKVDSIPAPLVVVPTELLQKLASEGETPPGAREATAEFSAQREKPAETGHDSAGSRRAALAILRLPSPPGRGAGGEGSRPAPATPPQSRGTRSGNRQNFAERRGILLARDWVAGAAKV